MCIELSAALLCSQRATRPAERGAFCFPIAKAPDGRNIGGFFTPQRFVPALQKSVARFVRRNHLETDVTHRLLDTVSELGELAKELLKASAYGRAKFAPGAGWQDELGDVGFSLLCLANSTGVDFDVAVRGALAKYRRRLAQHGTAASTRTAPRLARRSSRRARG